MIHFFRVCSVILIMSIVVLNGCAGPRSGVERHSTTAQPECFAPWGLGSERGGRDAEASVSSLLGYVRRVRAQPLDVQERELRRIEDGLEREYRPAEQLRLRLLLLLPETRLRNETRTRQLLRQMPKAGISEDYLGLAEAIEKAMTEQKRPATLPLEDVN